jgi:hypothetical protein
MPELELLTEKPFKNDEAMDGPDLGIVNVDKFRTNKVFLSSCTEQTDLQLVRVLSHHWRIWR